MKAVNLLPPDHKAVRQVGLGTSLSKHSVAIGGTAAALAVAAVLGAAYQSASNDASSQQGRLDAVNAQIASVSHPLNAASQSVRARIEQVTSADAARVSWDGFMTNFSRVLPEDVWLSTLQVQETAPAPAVPGSTTTTTPPAAPTPGVLPTGFTITGFTYSQASVARLMRRLSLLPWLSDVSLTNSNVTTVGTHSVYQFTIVGAVNSLPAKEAT
jgi:Tfp pilus assembly protein PilN